MAALKTFDQVDQRLITFRPGEIRRDPAAAVGKVCEIYKIAGPYLRMVGNVPLLPIKWRNTINKFCDLMDTLCAGGGVS